TYTWSSPLIIDYDLELDGNLRITSNVTLDGANLAIIQGDIETGRHYLIIEGDGSLTIQDGSLSSNLPLVVHLRDDGRLNTSNSQLLLSTPEGRGLIYSETSSVVEIEGGALEGDLMGLGSSFSLKGVSISSSSLTVDTGETSYLWDLAFEDGMELALLSDDGDVTTLDFDIRNITFSEDLTSSMLFRGTQYVQLTNIVFLGVGDWWDGRIFDDAKASFYWWLTVNAVDGVGDTVSGANITVERLNPLTLAFDPIPSPGPDDLYYGIYTGSNFEAPQGAILYRALVQERLASQGWSNSTYKANGSKVVDGQEYYAETEISVSMDDNTDVDLVFFNWPDLSVQESDVSFSTAPVEGGSVDVQVTVHNLGKADALGAIIELYDDTTLVDSVTVDIPLGTSELVTLNWVPQAAGTQTLRLWALSRNDTVSNTDLNMNNNFVSIEVQVLTRPDLELRFSEYGTLRVVEGRGFPVPVTVYNVGNTVASGFDVALYLNEVSSESLLAIQVGLLAPAAGNLSLSLDSPAVSEAGNHTLIVIADVSGVIPEIREDNNRVEFTLEVVPPEGKVFINLPQEGQSYSLGDQVFVSGSVNTPTGQPIPDMKVTVILRDTEGSFYDPKTVFTDQNGEYVVGLQLPAEAPSGEWVIMATAEAGTIESASLRLNVARVVPWYEFTVPMVNLPLWMLLVVLSIFLLVAFAITGYMKSVGLGRLAECGECGAFIPQSDTSCPKCGIEFENEMAKCSSCHAWIPLDVKKCPECGVEFTSGKTRTSDYRDRMRKQYEKVLEKYRDAASMALGRKPSEKEFQEWWRRQPTFLTFDDWLKEEEDMRKMGSKPCQICGALNSITASVCHKCGTLMSGNAPPTGGTGKPPAPPPGPPAPQQESAGKPVLKKILKKPFTRRKKKGG
ncbi:MAG: CARDB domain-containing protein, partial [Thermoplasmata archaeon]